MKVCAKCGETKPFSEFRKHRPAKDGLTYRCKSCLRADDRIRERDQREYLREYYSNNKSKLSAAARERYMKHAAEYRDKSRQYRLVNRQRVRLAQHLGTLSRYGLTIEQYDAMLIAQCGRCAACHSPEELVIDHCHRTGRVRGLLCGYCNRGLGQFKDSPNKLQQAAAYLESSILGATSSASIAEGILRAYEGSRNAALQTSNYRSLFDYSEQSKHLWLAFAKPQS